MVLSKGGISYEAALAMAEEERTGMVIALREANGWTYLGKGKWRKPQWMLEAERAREEARRGK